ncbi:hypothetical protein PHYC_02207 [Phycisphaerales bacterium]|nr:hypothetical protein PHYC_02207 [Phycisphaerales bacterium]
MPCLIAILAFFLPRVVLALIFLTSDYLAKAYQTAIWPLLGFFFFPYTTLAYAFAMHENGGKVSGGYLALVVVAVLLDLGSNGSGERARRKRLKTRPA